ncbi:MAG: hypothetical protein L6R40_004611 [Gallowayella cf. fulva]|nr:MAG: hypothetical protein L6R40_004611 [Xanthomendoza cf. fulva]
MSDKEELTGIEALPLDVKDDVSGYLSNFDAKQATRSIKGFRMMDNDGVKGRHAGVWTQIFKDSTWVSRVVSKGMNPILVGVRLSELYKGERTASDDPIILALDLAGSRGITLEPQFEEKIFFKSLTLPWAYDDRRHRVHLKQSNIFLIIEDLCHKSPYASLQRGDLLTRDPEDLSILSYCVCWKYPDYELYTISRQGIADEKGRLRGDPDPNRNIHQDYIYLSQFLDLQMYIKDFAASL